MLGRINKQMSKNAHDYKAGDSVHLASDVVTGGSQEADTFRKLLVKIKKEGKPGKVERTFPSSGHVNVQFEGHPLIGIHHSSLSRSPNTQHAEQFTEVGAPLASALKKHGYKFSGTGMYGEHDYEHPSGHSVALAAKKSQYWSHTPAGRSHGIHFAEGNTHAELINHLEKFHSSQHEEETEQFKEPLHLGNGWYFHKTAMDANGNHRVHVSKGANRGFSIQTNGVLPHTHKIRKGMELDENSKKELLNHLEKTRGVSQHEEEQEEQDFTTMIHPSLSSFGPAVLMKPQKPVVTQHAEQKLMAGRSAFLADKGRRFSKRLHQILRQHGGAVHNAHGGFTLPKRAAESFNQAAHDAGFQHGHHYSLNG